MTSPTPSIDLEFLKPWTMPDSYYGEVWPDYYVFLGKNRDSECLTRVNFDVGLERLGGESETVLVIREGHWLVGWVEWIAIHASDTEALLKAEEMLGALDRYPVLDEDLFSQVEWDEVTDYWGNLSIKERVEMCQEAELSIFAARHKSLPTDDDGFIYERLRG